MTVQYELQNDKGCEGVNLLILMYTHKVEPIALLRAGLEEFDLAISESSKETLVTNVAHTIQSEFGAALLKKYRLDSNLICLGHTTVVIHQSCNLKQVQGRIMFLSFSSRIIMIPMN